MTTACVLTMNVAHGVQLAPDSTRRPLPKFQANNSVLNNFELLLMSDVSATFFDGRYFELISRCQSASKSFHRDDWVNRF